MFKYPRWQALVQQLPFIFGQQLEIVLKQAKADGCMPSCPDILIPCFPIYPQYISIACFKNIDIQVPPMPSSGPTTTNFGQPKEIVVLKPNCSLRDQTVA